MLGKDLEFDPVDELTGEPRVKLANFNEIQQFAGSLKPDPRFIYLHVIAMGAGEYYGCNKNGDYFPERALKMYHHTFEQNAKVFKEHRNKPGDPDYGHVPKSWYNPEMHRVELVLAVDREKDPETVVRIERGELPEVSMGCKVPHDVCSICGNKASKKSDYCEHISSNLKRVYPDGRQAFMLNLQPTFFDISFVRRRADKIAFTLKKIAGQYVTSLEHVHDVEDKTASIEKTVPADAVVKLLNKGLMRELPRLEAQEKDIPAAMLDRLAARHSLKDILFSFLTNMVPMKPTEFTRIIIVKNGLPMSSFNDVLGGLMAGKHGVFEPGEAQQEISDMLSPYLENRSSFGPHVFSRLMNKTASSMSEAAMNDLLLSSPQYRYLYPDAEYYQPVHQSTIPVQHHSYASIPVQYAPEEYIARKQNRAALREPASPWTVGLMLAGLYAGYKGITAAQAAGKFLSTPQGKITTGVGAAALVSAMRPREKTAGAFVNKVVLPFVGAHLLSAHYRRKYYGGEELNGVEKTIAENPDYLSVAAPVALHYLGKKFNKTASELDSEQIKLADASDLLVNSAIQGIIFRGRGLSALSNSADMALDNMLLDQVSKQLVPKEETKREEPEKNFPQQRHFGYNSM